LPLERFKTTDLRLLDWAGGDRVIGTLNAIDYGNLFWGPQASNDGNAFIYSKVVAEGEDLVLIENFR
jgi:hypothetical protein